MNTHVRDNLNHLAEQISRSGWTSYTPTWTNLTVGNGTLTGKYAYAGVTTLFRVEFTLGSTSSVGSGPTFTFPQQAVAHESYHQLGFAVMHDVGTAVYNGLIIFSDTSNAALQILNVGSTYPTIVSVTSTVPFTWTTGDKLLISGYYERA
jgi:hypothetical protein